MLHPQHGLSKPPFLLSAALVKVGSELPSAALCLNGRCAGPSCRLSLYPSEDKQTEAGMPFLIMAEDHEDKEIERESVREAHRAHLSSAGKKLLASGAILGKDGQTIVGGASLLDTEDEDEARRFERDDPYAQAGIRAKVTIIPWRLRWWCGQFSVEGFQSY